MALAKTFSWLALVIASLLTRRAFLSGWFLIPVIFKKFLALPLPSKVTTKSKSPVSINSSSAKLPPISARLENQNLTKAKVFVMLMKSSSRKPARPLPNHYLNYETRTPPNQLRRDRIAPNFWLASTRPRLTVVRSSNANIFAQIIDQKPAGPCCFWLQHSKPRRNQNRNLTVKLGEMALAKLQPLFLIVAAYRFHGRQSLPLPKLFVESGIKILK